MSGRRRKGRDVSGWLALDKPVGITSTQAVARVKRLFQTGKAGHAGTLDPLASGCLPIALGEATKTVPFVVDGRKVYRFTIKWGEESSTDDAEGEIVARSQVRPTAAQIKAALVAFTGEIAQRPPAFSAVKVDGERAYNLAREGAPPELEPRPVTIHRLELAEVVDPDRSTLEAECGKGTYVRALARDLGRALGTFGHVTALRRLTVGPFAESALVTLADLEDCAAGGDPAACDRYLLPVQAALAGLTEIAVARPDAARLRRGQAVILRGRDAPIDGGPAYALVSGQLVAIGEIDRGSFQPNRVFHLG